MTRGHGRKASPSRLGLVALFALGLFATLLCITLLDSVGGDGLGWSPYSSPGGGRLLGSGQRLSPEVRIEKAQIQRGDVAYFVYRIRLGSLVRDLEFDPARFTSALRQLLPWK